MKKLVLLFIAMSMLFVACPSSPTSPSGGGNNINVAPSWAQGTYTWQPDTDNGITVIISSSGFTYIKGKESAPTSKNYYGFDYLKINQAEPTETQPVISEKVTVPTNNSEKFEFVMTQTWVHFNGDINTIPYTYIVTPNGECVTQGKTLTKTNF